MNAECLCQAINKYKEIGDIKMVEHVVNGYVFIQILSRTGLKKHMNPAKEVLLLNNSWN